MNFLQDSHEAGNGNDDCIDLKMNDVCIFLLDIAQSGQCLTAVFGL